MLGSLIIIFYMETVTVPLYCVCVCVFFFFFFFLVCFYFGGNLHVAAKAMSLC